MDEKIYSEDITVAASQNIKERDYWLAKLSGELTRTYFPYDRKGHAPVGYASDRVKQKYPERLFSKLIQLSNGVNYSLHVVLVAGVVLLLGKYTGSKDITVGTPIYKQEQEGEFINTVLALRNRLDRHMTFKQLLLQVKQTVMEATENQNYPYETLLYKLNRSSSNGGPPLFDVAVLLENIHDKQYIRHVNPDMIFCFKRTPQFMEGVVEYNPYLYQEASIRRIITHLCQLFQAALSGLDSPLTDIDLLSGDERKQILFDFNHTKKEFPRDELFAGLFEKTVTGSPHRVAAIHQDRHVTYKQLHRQVDGIAHLLLKQGVEPGKVAAVMMRRSVNMLASMLGIFKVGGVYLPVEVDLPGERIKYMLENSEARVLIADKENPPVLRGNIPCLQVTVTESAFGMNPPGNLQHQINPGNLAYMIYTSGTTGNPKGVLIHQRGMINHLYAKINELSITREDIIAQTASASFDISIWQFLTALIKGGTTAIIDKEVFLQPTRLLAILTKKKVTIMESVPSLMYQFFQLLDHDRDTQLKHMRWMLFTGEPLKVDLVKTWFQHYPGIKIANAYGPTEASDDITHHLMDGPPPGDETIVPIGKPLQNLHVYILNRDLQLCPIGAIGEICVAGVGVGKGYWKDPARTAQYFISNPYLDIIGDKDYSLLYKTGDLGRWLPDGTIEFLGRKDHQVKIRGYRIELGEIERHLAELPGVREAVVIDREDQKVGKYLCAYIVMSQPENNAFNAAELREYLKNRLPDAMIPAYFVPLAAIPLTLNGKVNRNALPEPETIIPGEEYAPPGNQTEQVSTGIWAEILKMEKDRISIDANFFQLGGHSLTATILITQIHKRLDVKVSLTEVFKTPTIRGLASYIISARKQPYQAIKIARQKDYLPAMERNRVSPPRGRDLINLPLPGSGITCPINCPVIWYLRFLSPSKISP
jgi:amino acid adenylation domain-containing protein